MLRKLSGGFFLLGVILTFVQISRSADDFSDAWVDSIGPDRGSLWGETMLIIKGDKFAKNQFTFGEGNSHLGNKVTLVSSWTSYPCPIHPDGCSEKQITCYTPPKMKPDEYTVQIQIDGKLIDPENYCKSDSNKCKFKPDDSYTPTITSIYPPSGKTGDMLTVKGKIFTSLFGSNVLKSSNDKTAKFLRNYVGSHPCDLKDLTTDQLYGITLNNDGTSDFGEFQCKLVTRDVGSLNASYIINEKYGRSKPDLGVFRVSSTGAIYMFQSYAWISDINPKEGSINGDTTITITGGNFDDTFAPADIMIAGTKCEVVDKVTADTIKCKTAAQPAAATALFEGGRGMNMAWWKETLKDLDEIKTLPTSASDYEELTLDRTHWEDTSDADGFSARATGLFVAPETSDYRFYIMGDDDVRLSLSTDETAANLEELATASVKNSYFDDLTSQESKRVALEKGKRYFMEILLREVSSRAFFKVAARADKSHVNAQMTGAAWHEIQQVIINSDVIQETQKLVLTKPNPQTKKKEIQTVSAAGISDIKFRLGFFNVYTVPLTTESTATEVQNALKQLPVLAGDDVTVTAEGINGGNTWTITFDSDAGNFPDLEYKLVDSTASGVTITISETTTGESPLTSFSLQMDNLPSPLIPVDASKAQVREKLLGLFGIRCPSDIANPPNNGYSEDFETSTAGYYGTRVSDEDPYCGRYSSKNPVYLWRKTGDSDKRGLSLNSFKWLCFAYRGSKKFLKMKYTFRDGENEKRTGWKDFDFTSEAERDKSDPPKWFYKCVNIYEIVEEARPNDSDYLLELIRIYRFSDSEDVFVDSINMAREEAKDIDIRRLYSEVSHIYSNIASEFPKFRPWVLASCFSSKTYKGQSVKIGLEMGPDGPVSKAIFALWSSYANEGHNDRRMRQVKPGGKHVNDVIVEKNSDEGYTIKIDIHDCGHEMSLFSAAFAKQPDTSKTEYQVTSNSQHLILTMSRIAAASPPITGNFKLGFKSKMTNPIKTFVEEEDLQTELELLGNTGRINVVRKGDCANHHYVVTWLTLPGDQEKLTMTSVLQGINVQASIKDVQDGGLWRDAIEGDMLRTLHDKPQVSAIFNGIPSACDGTCKFEWTEAATPKVTAVTITGGKRKKRAIASGSGALSTSITITGSGFSTTLLDNTVTIGGYPCGVTAATATSIICNVANGPAGTYVVEVNIKDSGKATSPAQFEYLTDITSLSPSTGGTSGGTVLTINGYGFGQGSTVEVDGQTCTDPVITTATIICNTPKATATSVTDVSVQVTQDGVAKEATQKFTYDYASTPTITQISATESPAAGGSTFTITGTKFGSDPAPKQTLWFCKTPVIVSSYTDTEIVGTFPAHASGSCDVVLRVGDIGFAETSLKITYKLKVTNVHPKRGSVSGGTKVTIDGEGFTEDNMNVNFGHIMCKIDSLTDTKIECTIEDTGKTHIVENNGTHQKYGGGYGWEPISQVIETGDSVKFIWKTPEGVTGINYMVQETASAISKEPKPGGFKSGSTGTPRGSFTQYFPVAGHYYYNSGPVDSSGIINIGGTIEVKDKTSFTKVLTLKVGEIEAIYADSGSTPSVSSSCPINLDPITGRTDPEPADKDLTKINFKFWTSLTAKISSISSNMGPTSEEVTIDGEGFSSEDCQNKIMIGDGRAVITEASTTQIKFTIDPTNKPPVGKDDSVWLSVHNRGYAMGGKNIKYTLIPGVTSMSPKSGSKVGGTIVTFTGTGFIDGATTVHLEGYACMIKSVSYTAIVCETNGGTTGSKDVVVTVRVDPNDLVAKWTGDSTFSYEEAQTPTLASVSPTTVTGSSTTLTVTGTGFGTTSADVTVKVGDTTTTVTAVSDTSITFNVGDVPVGSHDVHIHVAGKGNAEADPAVKVESSKIVSGITPLKGSLQGCQSITITGNGFVDDETTVTIGGEECVVLSVSPSQITCTTSAHAAGSEDVVVVSNGETYPSITYEYAQDMTPVLTSLSKDEGIEGDEIIATGSGFATTGNYFMVNGAEYPSTVATETSSKFILGNQPTRTYSVKVRVPEKGCTDSKTFKYNVGITSISPVKGTAGGEQVVTISGQGIVTVNTTVTICGKTCTYLDVPEQSASQYICLTPVPTSATNQVCDVDIEVNGLTDTLAQAYTYDPTITPEITNVEPRRGGTGGGTAVTITGTGFSTDVKVTIDGTDCPVSGAVTDVRIVCVTEESTSKKTVIKVNVNKNGIAVHDDNKADFWYIDVWSSRFTWNGSEPPVEGDFVVVPKGQVLLLDIDTPVLKMLLIRGGELIFDEKDITLKAENILITDDGTLQVGTEKDPFQHKAVIEMHGHLRSPELPIYGAKTLGIREGTLDLHGKPQTTMWTRLESTADKGATSITIQDAVDWKVDDEFVLATTGHRHSQNETETRKITAVSSDKKTLSFTEPLEFKHLGETLTLTGTSKTLEARAEVGLLTQNVVFRGSQNIQWQEKIEACPAGFDTGEFTTQTCFQGRFGEEMGSDQFGGAIMVHAPTPDKNIAKLRLSNVEVTHAGQAFRLGRYPVHFHLNGHMHESYIRQSSIHGTFNRAVNVHGTHDVIVLNNVIYDVMGGAFFLEDGIETNNTFEDNLAVFVRASTSLLNDDITPAAFWVTNPNNNVRGNAAAGGTHFGYWYRMHTHPDGPSATTDVRCKEVPLGEFSDNSAHSNGWFGVWIFEEYIPAGSDAAVFNGFTTWHNEKGLEVVILGNIQFTNVKAYGNDKAGIEYKKLKNWRKYDLDTGPAIKDSLIVSHHPSLLQETKIAIVVPWENGLYIDNVEFVNFDKPSKGTRAVFAVSLMQGTCSNLCGGYTYYVKNLQFYNSPEKIMFHWQHEGVFVDIDGSLTGSTSKSSVLPKSEILDPSNCVDADSGFEVGGVEASICDPSVKLHRFSSNDPMPESNLGKAQKIQNKFDTTTSDFTDKRVTHKNGWMAILQGGLTYNLLWENAEHITNFSYSGSMHSFTEASDFVIMCQKVAEKPDEVMVGGKKSALQNESLDNTKHYNGDWYFDSTEMKVCHLVSGRNRPDDGGTVGFDVRNVGVNAYKCFYKGCQKPPNPLEVTARPNPHSLYSDKDTWEHLGKRLPLENEQLEIPKDLWVVIDMQPPRFKTLTIHGGLEFKSGFPTELTLTADCIIVYGRLVIGWPEEPFIGVARIVLTGSHDTAECSSGDGPKVGSAALAVYGRLDINGNHTGKTWTSLATTATKNTDTLTLTDDVTWPVGHEVLITTTSFSAKHTEIFKIESVSGKTLKLNDTLTYTHSVVDDAKIGVTLSAKVALLTRNVKIQGGSPATMFDQSFGGRVLVASTTINETFLHVGIAVINGAEFVHTGQEGYTTSYDPRYSLAFVQCSSTSTVTDSSFHHGFSPAIGVYGVKDMKIDNNIVYHTVGSAIIADGTHTTISRNLITLVLWTGTYNGRLESKNVRWDAGIQLREAKEAVITGNVVAGSERAGFRVIGELCTGDSKWSGNEAHSSLAGLVAFDSEDKLVDPTCVRFAGFVFWRNAYYGIYYTHVASLEVVDCYFIENSLGLFPMVIGPSATAHAIGDKKVTVERCVFVGQTSDFDCTYHKIDDNDKNIEYSSQAQGIVRMGDVGMVGMTFTVFSQGSNQSPRKPWTNIMAYMAIAGLTEIKGVKFIYYGKYCGSNTMRNFALATNKDNDDMNHKTKTSGLTMDLSVEDDSKIYFHRPNLGKINPSDCVDMDCDGLKKIVVEDMDGSLLGQPGTVIPQSQYEWDGDPRRGLGDYRIPRQMLADENGNKLKFSDIAQHRGIVGYANCVYRTAWQAYKCHDMDHRMLVVENMDKDTELRRLSPVAILTNGYLDLANGPQDHGWCAGYTCQKRLSTFHFIVSKETTAVIYFTSTSPQTTRLMLLNSDDSVAVLVAVWYARRFRLDTYVNNVFISPNNADREGTKFSYKKMSIEDCKPNISSTVHGSNCNDETTGLYYALLRGSIPVDIRTIPQVVVDLIFMTVDEFLGEEIIKNLATFLKIDESKIRIVKIIRASRRKRNALVETKVLVECGDTPDTHGSAAMTQEQLQEAATSINNGALLGNLPIGPDGVNPTVVTLQEPLPTVDSPAWGQMEQDPQPYTISKAGRMTFYEDAVPGREGQEFPTPIRLRIYDESGVAINNVGTTANPWQVEATLKTGPGSHASAFLGGTTVQNFTGGWANFTDLHISHLGEDYSIEFNVIYPVSNFSEETPSMTILKRDLEALMVNKTDVIMEGAPMTLWLGLRDRNTMLPVSDINWRGHTWSVTASASEGTLTGTNTANFDPSTGYAIFNDLQFDEIGRYYINFTITSTPLEYAFIHEMYVDITNQAVEDIPKDKTSTCQFKFDTEYHVHRSPRDVARFARQWAIRFKTLGVKVLDSTASSGSVIATLVVEGSTGGVDRIISDLCKAVKKSEKYEFNGEIIPMEPYMKVDGKNTCGPESGNQLALHPGIIAAIVIAILLVIVIVVILVVWRCVIVPKNKTYDSNRDLHTLAKVNGRYTIEDYLFRDKTFNSIKSQAPTPAAPAATAGKTFSLSVDSRLDMYDDRPSSTASARSLQPKMPLPSD